MRYLELIGVECFENESSIPNEKMTYEFYKVCIDVHRIESFGDSDHENISIIITHSGIEHYVKMPYKALKSKITECQLNMNN